ncbi:nucleolin-like isoform X2 [Poecilia reticulata]|uniref:nucleolin-like isoform X2 n=1 Tax=Poecilia reticulata TaxID=8081 RepID=UPI0004A24190|nr:PREDICTED: nucleolin-like isoform X2 [Poecilia reticulata]
MAKKQNKRHKKSQNRNIKEENTHNNDWQPEENTEVEMRQEESGDEQDLQVDIEVKRNVPTVTVSWEKKGAEGEEDKTERTVNRKRTADAASDSSPSKKTKLTNDGLCLYVGNLNFTKTSEEIRSSLAKCFMTQSLLFHDIRLGHSKRHAFVDMASDMDLKKALALNGEEILDKPMKMAKAKVKSNNQGKSKAPPVDKKVKDKRCLFLKNVPYDATEEDIRKVFHKAISVRFPGGAKSPTQGIAFVEFKNKAIAEEMLKKKQTAQIKGRNLILDNVQQREADEGKASGKKTKAAAPPNNILFVTRLPEKAKERHLKYAFKKAVGVRILTRPGVTAGKDEGKRFAFVEFATVANAEKALQRSKTIKLCNQKIKVERGRIGVKPVKAEGQQKTLFVAGLAETTTAETLQSAFDRAVSARVAVDKSTGTSKRFGFVEFDSEENCKAAKDGMEDCKIDGSRVTVIYAAPRGESSSGPAGGGGVAWHTRQETKVNDVDLELRHQAAEEVKTTI